MSEYFQSTLDYLAYVSRGRAAIILNDEKFGVHFVTTLHEGDISVFAQEAILYSIVIYVKAIISKIFR